MVFKEALSRQKPAERALAADLRHGPRQGRHRQGARRASIRPTSPPTSPRSAWRGSSSRTRRGYRVGKEIREMVIFATQNLVMDPPFTKLDILTCRNLLIYLDAGAAEEAPAALPLQPESRRHPASGQRGDASARRPISLSRWPARAATLPARESDGAPIRCEFPSTFTRGAHRCAAIVAHRRRPRPARQPPGAGRQLLLQRYSPGGRARQRRGRHPLRQRQDGQIPGARGGQGQLEHLCHGPRGLAPRADEAFQQGASGKRAPVTAHGREGGHQRRHAGRRHHRPAARRARRRCGEWSWSCSRTSAERARGKGARRHPAATSTAPG